MALPPRDQRHQYLRFEGLQYTDADITDFETRLGKIYRREVHRVHVFDFGGLTDLMAEGLSGMMLMEHKDAQGQEAVLDLDTVGALQFQLGGVRHRMSWREFILGMGLNIVEEIKSVRFGAYWAESARQILNKGDLSDYWREISSARDFLGTTPSYTYIRDPMLRLCHRLIACSIAGRSLATKKGDMISGGQFVARLAEHFGLLSEERLQGLTVIIQDLLEIDIAELVDAAEAAEDAHVVNEGASTVPALVQAPQPPPPMVRPARTMEQRLGRLDEDIHSLRGTLGEQR
ncbi:hypothetical protein Tco_1447054 [Tanacetum coccineum]